MSKARGSGDQEESGQAMGPAVVTRVYDVTRGQPGLISSPKFLLSNFKFQAVKVM